MTGTERNEGIRLSETDSRDAQLSEAIPTWVKKMDSSYVHFTLSIPIVIWIGVLTFVAAASGGKSMIYRTSILLFAMSCVLAPSIGAIDLLLRRIVEQRIGCKAKGRFSYFYQLALVQEASVDRLMLYAIGGLDMAVCICTGFAIIGGLPLIFYMMTQLRYQ